MEYLNLELDVARNLHIQLVVYMLTESDLIDLMHHFRKRRRFRNLKTWTQFRKGTMLQAMCDYILCTERCLFNVLGIKDIRNYSLYHFALWARLLQLPT